MAIVFMSFGGMLTGGDEEKKEETKTAIESKLDEEEKANKKIADNTIKGIE
jgi:Na+-transporting NADH:ubiquinone oxidoreductase subunit E